MTKSMPELTLLDRILEAARVGENDDWEFKSSKGGFPGSFWETYSAMANTAGGAVVLGATEKNSNISLDGLSAEQLEKHKKVLWDGLNNKGMVSRNLLASSQVEAVPVDGGWILVIRIPQATRKERPIYKGQNPFGGTFKRNHEGDYKCSDDEVRRMFADAGDTPADARILDGFKFSDLDGASIRGFRNRFASTKSDHPWLELSDKDLVVKLGGWRKDKQDGKEGVTLAGMLMFGKHQAIIDPSVAPAYMVDYRDFRGRRGPNDRWTDRLFPDGTWEANLFQFYQRCRVKIEADLKVPFVLKAGQRVDETPVHVALREALINSLIHTDYSVGGGIVIERYEDRYHFSNPGTLLVSEAQLLQGGVSECRNRSLQRMFMLIGGGEQAGSGYARIQTGWKGQFWRAPQLTTQSAPDRVRLDMPMISLMPEEIVVGLQRALGAKLDQLNDIARLALATAAIERSVTNKRMQDLVKDHPSDITKTLRTLVKDGLLVQVNENQGRWTRYVLEASLTPYLTPAEFHLDNPSAITEEKLAILIDQTKGTSNPDRVMVEAIILRLCFGTYRTAKELGKLMQRKSPARLRDRYLTPMVEDGRLVRLHEAYDHPNQAYRTAAS